MVLVPPTMCLRRVVKDGAMMAVIRGWGSAAGSAAAETAAGRAAESAAVGLVAAETAAARAAVSAAGGGRAGGGGDAPTTLPSGQSPSP